MNFISEFHKIIWYEFASWYLSGETPNPWQENFVQSEWLEITRASAIRMNYKLKPEEVQEFIEMLESASENQTHSVVQTIDNAGEYEWSDEPESWRTLQNVLRLIAEQIKQLQNEKSQKHEI